MAKNLERRGNKARERVSELQLRIEQYQASRESLPLATSEEFSERAGKFKAVWDSPQTDARLKKRVVRELIHEVLVDLDHQTNEVVLIIHWQGGVHTELRVPRRRRRIALRPAIDIIEAVRRLTPRVQRWSDRRYSEPQQPEKRPRQPLDKGTRRLAAKVSTDSAARR